MSTGRSTVRFSQLNLLDEEDVAAAIRRIYASRDFKRHLEREFETNVDFWEGGVKAWRKWDAGGTKRVLDPAIKEDQLLMSLNLILEVGETLASRFVRYRPTLTTVPVTNDRRDVQRARMLKDLLSYAYTTTLQMPTALAAFLKLCFCSPVSWMTGGWEPNRGQIVTTTLDDMIRTKINPDNEEGFSLDRVAPEEQYNAQIDAAEEFIKQFGEAAFKKGSVTQYAGEEYSKNIPITEMCWYPWRVKHWDDVQAYLHTTEEPIEQVAEELRMSAAEVRQRAYGQRRGAAGFPALQSDSRIYRPRGTTRGMEEAETVLYHQFFFKPTLKYPEGVQAVTLGNDPRAVKVGPITNKFHEMPFFPFVQHPIPDQAWGTCLVSQLRSAQMDLNKAASQETKYRDQMIFNTICVPTGGIVDQDDWRFTNRPGEQKKVRGGQENAPYILQRPTVGFDYLRAIDRDITFIRELASVSAIQAGKTDDAHIRSGRAIDKLDEKTNERLVENSMRLDAHQERFWTFMAGEFQSKPTGQRVAQIIGEDNEMELIDWDRESLRPTTWDEPNRLVALVKFQSSGELPMSGAARRDTVMALIKGQVLRPGEHDAQIWKMLGGGETRYFQDEQRKDRVRQNWEIEQWRKGQLVPPPLEQQDHEVHNEQIKEWIRTGNEYFEIVQQFPYLHAEIQHHIRLHDMLRYKDPMMQERAKAEAWINTIQGIGRDLQQGRVDKRILDMVADGTLLPLAAIFGMQGESVDVGGVAGAPSGPPAGTNGQGRQGVGEGEGRDQRRDLADAGVDPKNLAGVGV
jgi:hypothetical protein